MGRGLILAILAALVAGCASRGPVRRGATVALAEVRLDDEIATRPDSQVLGRVLEDVLRYALAQCPDCRYLAPGSSEQPEASLTVHLTEGSFTGVRGSKELITEVLNVRVAMNGYATVESRGSQDATRKIDLTRAKEEWDRCTRVVFDPEGNLVGFGTGSMSWTGQILSTHEPEFKGCYVALTSTAELAACALADDLFERLGFGIIPWGDSAVSRTLPVPENDETDPLE